MCISARSKFPYLEINAHDACLSLIVMMSFGFNLNLHSYFTLINERSFNKVLSLFGTLWLFHLYIEIQMHFNC